MLVLRPILVFALAVIAGGGVAQSPLQVDLLLVLAADVSRSVDRSDFRLQRSGYAAAFSDPQVISAIRAGPTGRIAVAYVEWSGPWMQKSVIDWTLIDSERAAHDFSRRLLEAPRAYSKRSTSISAAIDYASMQFARAPYRTSRRVLDISGDGENNTGRPVSAARNGAVSRGITINGLVIAGSGKPVAPPGHPQAPISIEHYYRGNVIGGAGAFVEVAEGYDSFGAALIRKLVREIAWGAASPAGLHPRRAQARPPAVRAN